MKKLLFTAIAVIAFSGVSMAENLVKDNVEKVTKKKVLASSDCLAEKFIAYCDFIAAGIPAAEASSASYSIYFTCMLLQAPGGQE